MYYWVLNTPLLKYLVTSKLLIFSILTTYWTNITCVIFSFFIFLTCMNLKLTLRIFFNKWKQSLISELHTSDVTKVMTWICYLLLSRTIIYHAWKWRMGVQRLSINSVCPSNNNVFFIWFLLIENTNNMAC